MGAFAAKTELSKLLRQTRAGKCFIITQHGEPVAELRPITPPENPPGGRRGDMKGRIHMSDDFCDPIIGDGWHNRRFRPHPRDRTQLPANTPRTP
ncbi:MAG: type II toxin-antitoxin system prevent-host-death family antitoxin [Verrucomicrobia bacterium]|nr:type II toxin-antitoxin system prevent-host-death family antitoxin [Verrucomicrobiota bacterium]